jgi:hypothetical protein
MRDAQLGAAAGVLLLACEAMLARCVLLSCLCLGGCTLGSGIDVPSANIDTGNLGTGAGASDGAAGPPVLPQEDDDDESGGAGGEAGSSGLPRPAVR